jgi:nucleoside-diphosphate-sugar epimerase
VKVVVTGGAEFIGSHIVNLPVENGHHEEVIDLNKEHYFHCEKASYYLENRTYHIMKKINLSRETDLLTGLQGTIDFFQSENLLNNV